MALAPGALLGAYEIVALVGAGGMGLPPLRGGSMKLEVRRLKAHTEHLCR